MAIDPVQERLYNIRAAIPDHMSVFANWRMWSDAYRQERPQAKLDLAYGKKSGETLDFFPPVRQNPSPSPLVVLIHGGYWQAMDKGDNSFAARALCDAGFSVAVLNYTLCPAITLEGIVDEIQRASLWLWHRAEDLLFARDHMYVAGHSAGGHLAAMMVCTPWKALNALAPKQVFKGALSISGIFDLSPLTKTTINDNVGMTPQSARELSPVHQKPCGGLPFIAAVGANESAAFHEQADHLKQAWAHTDVEVRYMRIPNSHHFQAFEALADMNSEIFKAFYELAFRRSGPHGKL